MPEPLDPAALDLKYHTLALCLLIEFFVRDLIGPEDATIPIVLFALNNNRIEPKCLKGG